MPGRATLLGTVRLKLRFRPRYDPIGLSLAINRDALVGNRVRPITPGVARRQNGSQLIVLHESMSRHHRGTPSTGLPLILIGPISPCTATAIKRFASPVTQSLAASVGAILGRPLPSAW